MLVVFSCWVMRTFSFFCTVTTNISAEPPSKRIRRMPCPCRACLGKERDHWTVQSHLALTGMETPICQQPLTPTTPEVYMYDEFNGCSELEQGQNETTPRITQEPTLNDKVMTYVMNEILTKLNYGHSQSEFEEHMRNTARLVGDTCSLPTTWSDTLKVLKELGYKNPKHYKVCLGHNHSELLHDQADGCSVCRKPRNACIDYYVLGLHFEDWFCTLERCNQLMCHWENRDEQNYGMEKDGKSCHTSGTLQKRPSYLNDASIVNELSL